MGLTIGAIGTSFPNLYASILTARAGQAGMSLCQVIMPPPPASPM